MNDPAALAKLLGGGAGPKEPSPLVIEGARLYADLMDRARNEILQAASPENELLDARVLWRKPAHGLGTEVLGAFKLNGKAFTFRVEIGERENFTATMSAARDLLMERLSRAIAESLKSEAGP